MKTFDEAEFYKVLALIGVISMGVLFISMIGLAIYGTADFVINGYK